ncbi:MAG: thioesterase family protein [Burkholderiales bacterium]
MTSLRMKAVQAVLKQVMEVHIAFNKHLGLKVESFDPQAPKLRFDMRPELVGNPLLKILHGGVISAALDVAGGFAIMLQIASNDIEITAAKFPKLGTIDLRVDYLRPGRGKHFIATAKIVRKGSRISVVHMELHNDAGELIATGGGAYVVG